MRHLARLVPLVLLVLGSCVLAPEVVGEGLSTDSGETATSVTTVATVTTEERPPEAGQYGAPCELLDLAEPPASKAASPQPACAGEVCVFAFEDGAPPCADDSECSGPWSSCDGDSCALDPDFVTAHTQCTQTCSETSECPPMAGCAEVVCAPVTTLGPLCCEKLCLCDDYLHATPTLTSLCETESPCDG